MLKRTIAIALTGASLPGLRGTAIAAPGSMDGTDVPVYLSREPFYATKPDTSDSVQPRGAQGPVCSDEGNVKEALPNRNFGGDSGEIPIAVLPQQSAPVSARSREDASSGAAQKLVGMWRLVSFTQNGRPHPVYGRQPSGLIAYDSTGHMAAQIMPDRARPSIAGAEPTPDEAKAAIVAYIAYFGRYTVDERAQTVTHHRLGNLMPGEPLAAVRHYEFLPGDRLALTLGEDPTAQVLWQRVR